METDKLICECTDANCEHCKGKCLQQAETTTTDGMEFLCEGCLAERFTNALDLVSADCYF
jgi:hypothetical protein